MAVARRIGASTAEAADLVLVAPPFSSPDRPSLGLHVIARVAEAGHRRPADTTTDVDVWRGRGRAVPGTLF